MSRRIRPAALLAAAALLVGGSASLALAPAASAAGPGDPQLGQLSFSPSNPEVGDTLVVKGGGCVGTSAAATAADPGQVNPAADPAPGVGTVNVTVKNASGTVNSISTVQAGTDGSWASNSNSYNPAITLTDSGDFTISATCSIAGLITVFNYDSASFTIDSATTPPPTPGANPTVVVNPTGSVAPGTSVTVTGIGFDGATTAAVTLNGYTTQNVPVSGGGFSGVTFALRADQAGGTLAGSVKTDNNLSKDYSVVVAAPQTGSVDGTVPGGTGSGSTTTTTGSGSTTTTTGSTTTGRGYVASKPSLPNTGTDTLWPGLVGGLLLVSGAGLVWAGRRREETGTAAV